MSDGASMDSDRLRSRLLERISSRPGSSVPELSEHFKKKKGTLRYHLRNLERDHHIHSRMLRGTRCYFPGSKGSGYVSDERREETRHLSDIQKRIVDVVEENPDITQKEIVRTLRTNRFQISYNVRKLMEMGLVRIRRQGRCVHYRRAHPEDIKMEILRILTEDLARGRIDENTYLEIRRELMKR
jgi:predicted transcriptional regulator